MNPLIFSIVALTAGIFQSGAADIQQTLGSTYSPKVQISVEVPRQTLKNLPTNIPVYAIDRTPFPVEAVTWIIDHGINDPVERTALKKRIEENPSLLTTGKTVLKNDEHGRLNVDPEKGILGYDLGGHDWPKVPLTNAPSAAISFDTFKRTLRELASKLRIDESEIARKPDGEYFRMVSDNERFPHHQKQPILYKRSVTYSRRANGFTTVIGYSDDFEIELGRFVSGEWSRIFIYWPKLKAVGSCRPYLSSEEIRSAIQSGKSWWAYSNNDEIDEERVKRIAVTDLRVFYATLKGGLSVPVMCLDCDMTTQEGKQYGLLFLPLDKSP
jgi:hypothetical protein